MAHNTRAKAPARQRQAMTSEATPTTRTFEGAPAYRRDSKSDLYLLATVDFGGNAFYESAATRQARLQGLAQAVGLEDPEWLVDFITWLRSKSGGAMRSAPLTIAAEAVHARLAAGKQGSVNSQLIRTSLMRADEPGELVAYWTSRFGTEHDAAGRMKAKLPYPVKRGIKAAIEGLPDGEIRSIWNEYSAMKYDTDSKAVRFADLVALTHPRPTSDMQLQFFVWLADRRHGRALDGHHLVPDLTQVHARHSLAARGQTWNKEARHDFMVGATGRGTVAEQTMRDAGVTWEWMASWYDQPLDKAFWSAMAPQLPYFALLRNLRNLDEVGLDKARAEMLARKIADEAQVRKSGIFPFQFLTAYHNVRDDRWLSAISDAASHSVANIPTLPGRTLVLVDTSASMEQLMAQREDTKGHRPADDEPQAWRPRRVDAAALFATSWALANRAGTDLWLFASTTTPHRSPPGVSLLRAVTDMTKRIGVVGHGTRIAEALRATWRKHDRVIIFTDEQTFGGGWAQQGVSDVVPDSVPLYSFNLAGYAGSMLPLQKPNRIQLGGLSDKVFSAIGSYESGRRADWPWENQG